MAAASKNTHTTIPRVQRARRRLCTGEVRYHYYHRPTKIRLPSPENANFESAYDAAERQWAFQQAAASASEAQDGQTKNQSLITPQHYPAASPITPEFVTQNTAEHTKPPAKVVFKIAGRRASITQADMVRIIRAAKQAGAEKVEVRVAERATVIIRLEFPRIGAFRRRPQQGQSRHHR
jgi:hypothetical protein